MMNVTDISFPNLNIYLSNVPQSFTVFGFEIALYGVVIALGIAAGVLLAAEIAKRYCYDSEIIWDFAIYAIIFSIIGARIYYVVFSWDDYKNDLLSILKLRNGGLAIYGAVIGAFLTLYVYSKIKKVHYLTIADICVPGLALGQVMGRWGNFFNREVFGEYSDGLLAMRLPIEAVRPIDISEDLASHIIEGTNYIQVHPTFLYESLWNVAVIIVMLLVWKHRKFAGQITLIYLGGYGLGRFWIEGIRTDQLKIGNTGIAVSQALALILFIFATVTMVIVLKIKGFKEPVKEIKLQDETTDVTEEVVTEEMVTEQAEEAVTENVETIEETDVE